MSEQNPFAPDALADAVKKELDKVEVEHANSVEADITTEGAEIAASVPIKWGARLTAFLKTRWHKEKPEAGLRIEKKF